MKTLFDQIKLEGTKREQQTGLRSNAIELDQSLKSILSFL